jgi:hypothetical protein
MQARGNLFAPISCYFKFHSHQSIYIALSFVSGFLSLFGVGLKMKKTVGEIVREEIQAAFEKYHDQKLIKDAKGNI